MIKNKYANLFLFFSLLAADAAAQPYIPIPEANARWNIHEQSYMPCAMNTAFQWGNRDLTITINGDTLINGFIYKKLYSTGHFYTTPISPAPPIYCNDNLDYYVYDEYYGAFRNDTVAKKVMFVRSGYPAECLMFDFSLNVGSSLTGISCMMNPPNGIVLDDTLLVLGGVSRHAYVYGYNYSPLFGYETSIIIEGIGSLSAGLADLYHHFEWYSQLLCFSVNDVTIYPDSVTACDIIDMIKKPGTDKESAVSISPNPFTESAAAIFNRQLHNATFSLYNLLGEKVKTVSGIQGKSLQIDRGNLQSGMYVYEVIEEGKRIGGGKAVVY